MPSPLNAASRSPATDARSPLRWLLALLALATWYVPFASRVGLTGLVADDALYLLMADGLSAVQPDDMMLRYVLHIAHLPPLYPLLLALTGGGSAQLDIAHLTQAMLVLAALFAHGWFARQVFVSDHHGLLVLLVLAALPATLLFSTELLSEFLYLTLAGGALVAAIAARGHARWWLVAAVLAGLAAITRGTGILLIAALCVTLVLRNRRYVLPCSMLAVSPLVAVAVSGLGGSSDYIEIFASRVGDAAGLRSSLIANVAALWDGWLALFGPAPGPVVMVIGGITLGLAGLGLLWRLAANELDGFYVGGYLLVIALWPFPHVAHRLLYPLAPLAIVYAGLGAASLAAPFGWLRDRRPATVPLVTLLLLATWSSTPLVMRYLSPAPLGQESLRTSRYWLTAPTRAAGEADLEVKLAMVELLRLAGTEIPPQECIYTQHPQAVMFYTRRVAWPPETGAARPAEPNCSFHILLADATLAAGHAALWPDYRVVLEEGVRDGTAALLVRYPR